jgi:RND family efflux transporter MFP subunit
VKRKRIIKRFSLFFIGGLLVLTLYSNTLLSMSLPKVWVTFAKQEALVHVLNGDGVLKPALEASISNKSGWEIQEVRVAEGDSVKKGKTLVTYANREDENRYLDARAQLKQQQLAIDELQDQYVEASRNSDDQLIRTVKRNLAGAQITLEVQQRNVDSLKEALDTKRELKAPFDGIVTKVNAVEGMPSASFGPDILLASPKQGYEMQIPIPASVSRLIRIGQETEIQVQLADMKETMSGVIKGIETEAQDEGIASKHIIINVINEKLRGGEQASVWLRFPSPDVEGGMVVPNEAIHREGNESYVFVVEEKKGALGNTSVARKVNVQTGDANERETVVKGGVFPDAPIILKSNEPIQDGERVRAKTNS